MDQIDSRIVELIHEHHIFTLATSVDDKPWVATCFYVYHEEMNMFIFTSDFGTRHVEHLEKNHHVAGAIALETSMVGQIRGIQFAGKAKLLTTVELKKGKKHYLKKFPVAYLKKTTLWGIEPEVLKMTDNRLGFGKKLIWQKNNELQMLKA